jgi:hypothetical protein
MSGFHVKYIPPPLYVYEDQKPYKPAKKLTKQEVNQSEGAGTYGSGGSLAVHHVIVDLMWEIPLVMILSAIAAHGGTAKTLATVLMIGIAVVWALNTFG